MKGIVEILFMDGYTEEYTPEQVEGVLERPWGVEIIYNMTGTRADGTAKWGRNITYPWHLIKAIDRQGYLL